MSDSQNPVLRDASGRYGDRESLERLMRSILASVPDLIIIVDYETSEPINAERLRYGQRVAVFAVGCPAFYRTEAALDVVSPRNFGFDVDYVPLEALPN